MKDDGGPAFPTMMTDDYYNNQNGMSLRDWFAGMAMQGMFASDTVENCIPIDRKACLAYLMADEMLKARGS